MKFVDEIEVLRTVVKVLTPLKPAAQQRVIDYVCNKFGVGRVQTPSISSQEVRQATPLADVAETSKPTAPQQYLRDFNYKIMTKRIGIIAVFLERERAMKRFSLRDITDAFRAAKEPKMPAHSQYARSVAMGYLAKEADQYYATSKAENLVNAYPKRQSTVSGEGES